MLWQQGLCARRSVLRAVVLVSGQALILKRHRAPIHCLKPRLTGVCLPACMPASTTVRLGTFARPGCGLFSSSSPKFCCPNSTCTRRRSKLAKQDRIPHVWPGRPGRLPASLPFAFACCSNRYSCVGILFLLLPLFCRFCSVSFSVFLFFFLPSIERIKNIQGKSCTAQKFGAGSALCPPNVRKLYSNMQCTLRFCG